MGLEWQENVSGGTPQAVHAVCDAFAARYAAHAACDEGSTDESMDRDILVDATPLPVPLSGGCCEGGMCRPKPETRVYQAKCEDSTPQTTHFERLDALQMRPGLICEQAAKIVAGVRQEHYGSVEMNFERIALLDEALDCCIATMPEGHVNGNVKVALRNILQKVARLVCTPSHTDSWRDIAGYADCGARCAGCDPLG